MCHPEVPAGQPAPEVPREEVSIGLDSGESMPALLARPETPARGAVLVIADVFGRSPFYEDLAGRLALAGFTALLPDYFFRQGPLPEPTREAAMARRQRLDLSRTPDDLQSALEWQRANAGARGRLGTVGFCMGGTLVLQLQARRDDVAGVCYYGFPGNLDPDTVDRIRGPLLGFWGDQDAGVGMENVERLAAALKARQADFEHHVYPGLGHGFMAASRLEPGNDAYEKACESWTRALDFFRRHLG